MIDTKLANLGLKDDEIKTLIFLLENGPQGAGIIAKKTGISRPSLYGYLKNLQEKGFAIQSQKDGVKTFSVASEEKINGILDTSIKKIEESREALKSAFSEIKNGNAPMMGPRLQIFEGQKELQFVLKDMLLYKNMETKAYWPIKSMIGTLGEEFFRQFNKDRIARNIYTKAIWPEGERVDVKKHPYLGVGEEFLREIRIAPKEIEFSMGYWIYEDKVAFISSAKDNFGFILEGKEFAQMLSSQFEVIWKLSKEMQVKREDMQSFIDEMKTKK